MKKLLIILFVLAVNFSHAQTWDEWFRQKKTAIKYLVNQIAAFQVYIGYAEKGYAVINKGLTTIGDIKNGDFHLHSNYFNALSVVNPAIKKYRRVAEIISLQISMGKQIASTIKSCRNANALTASELKYLHTVFNNLLDDCGKNLDELIMLISDNNSKMKDDERIKRIDLLFDDMKDKQMFTTSFCHSAKGLTIQRKNDENDIIISKKLNGL